MTGPDVQSLMIPLAPAKVGVNGYTQARRYQDFRAVFFGEADQDQKERVLYQIFAVAELHGYLVGRDPYDTYRLLGRREVGMEILSWLTMEPKSGQFSPTTESE